VRVRWTWVSTPPGQRRDRRIVGGDFNAPALEPHEHAGDRTLCFGYVHRDASGKSRGMAPTVVAELRELGNVALPEEYWPEWQPESAPEGTTRDGRAWEAIESWIFNARDEHGLIDAFRQAPDNLASSAHSHFAGHKIPMRYDHIFVRGYTPTSANYVPELLGRNVAEGSKLHSDHAPLVAVVKPVAQ
jgi:endonuclease/exonuclease/phosphatase family metal-dependent hydrolase